MADTNSNGDHLSIRITNREMYDMLVQLRDATRALEYRVDSVLSENVTLHKRVRALELRFYGVLAGLIASVTALGAGLGFS